MQSIYATKHSNFGNIKSQEKFLNKSMQDMFDLFIINLNLLVNISMCAEKFYNQSKKKHLPSQEDKSPNLKFVNNKILQKLKTSKILEKINHQKKLDIWDFDDEYPALLWDEIKQSEIYYEYLNHKKSSYDIDKFYIIEIYKKIIAPNDKLYEYFEDHKLTWIDDLPIVNTSLIRFLKFIPKHSKDLKFPELFKNKDDYEFGIQLLQKTLLNEDTFSKDIVKNTQNWDKERIASLDYIMLLMACTEFNKFPSIPIKVSINEYLEIAKNYSTPKSSNFINGVLDKIVKQYKNENRLNKSG
ncbi:transcription antitermination protein NusB [Flavobacterium sp. CS20]|uniref:transcription antitermination protein NusB n=1 Tax=Flavobacterium sp. CS20 TaxID=2775246 RepID=UPI001FFDE4DC|nr:transcription antitermination protein NusB [Flavobacterium sp. CS20]